MRVLFLLALSSVFLLAACTPGITDYEGCVAAGYPSADGRCEAGGETFFAVSFVECSEDERQGDVCTTMYDPVCGLVDGDTSTFDNACMACAQDVSSYVKGACDEQLFVVCGEEPVTGFSPREHAAAIGGVCVDSCPQDYDAYVTQIGVSLCIQHYGEGEIAAWETCERSSETCECALAYETTRGETVEEPSYRCVPEQYAERLLFRAGLDRLDEDGEPSVAIA